MDMKRYLTAAVVAAALAARPAWAAHADKT